MATGQCAAVLEGHTSPVFSCHLSPHPSGDAALRVVSAGAFPDPSLRVWDVGAALWGRVNEVTGELVAAQLGGSAVLGPAAADCGGARGKQQPAKQPQHGASSGVKKQQGAQPAQQPAGACAAVLPGHAMGTAAARFSPDGCLAASCGSDMAVKVWAVAPPEPETPAEAAYFARLQWPRRAPLALLSGHRGRVTCLDWRPDGDAIVTGSWDYSLILWELSAVSTDGCPLESTSTAQVEPARVFSGHNNGVTGCCFSPDGESVLSCSMDRTMRLWDVESGAVMLVFSSAAYEKDECVTGGAAAAQQAAHGNNPLEPFFTACCFSRDGRFVASGESRGERAVRVWCAVTGACVFRLPAASHGGLLSSCCVAFSPDGDMLCTGGGGDDAGPAGAQRLSLWPVAWSQRSHRLFPETFRAAARTALLCVHRCLREAAQRTEAACGRGGESSAAASAAAAAAAVFARAASGAEAGPAPSRQQQQQQQPAASSGESAPALTAAATDDSACSSLTQRFSSEDGEEVAQQPTKPPPRSTGAAAAARTDALAPQVPGPLPSPRPVPSPTRAERSPARFPALPPRSPALLPLPEADDEDLDSPLLLLGADDAECMGVWGVREQASFSFCCGDEGIIFAAPAPRPEEQGLLLGFPAAAPACSSAAAAAPAPSRRTDSLLCSTAESPKPREEQQQQQQAAQQPAPQQPPPPPAAASSGTGAFSAVFSAAAAAVLPFSGYAHLGWEAMDTDDDSLFLPLLAEEEQRWRSGGGASASAFALASSSGASGVAASGEAAFSALAQAILGAMAGAHFAAAYAPGRLRQCAGPMEAAAAANAMAGRSPTKRPPKAALLAGQPTAAAARAIQQQGARASGRTARAAPKRFAADSDDDY